MTENQMAKFIGVGVGPGDPELITLKAARYIEHADVISYIANESGYSLGRDIASALLDASNKKIEVPVVLNMYKGRALINQAYDEAAQQIAEYVKADKTVVFLCEGDPLFFGSFSYLLARLEAIIECAVVPGISSVNTAASVLKKPLTLLRESFAVLSGRHDQATLVHTLNTHDTVVIMKAGRQRQTILAALAEANRMHEAHYLENLSRDDEQITMDVQQLPVQPGPYFSMFVVLREHRNQD